MARNKGSLTVREAGKLGGEQTAQTHGKEFYSEIGHKGGQLGGQKGGQATSKKYGPEFYSEIGHKGGQKVKKLIENAKKSEK